MQELAFAARKKGACEADVKQLSACLDAAKVRLAALELESSDTAERALMAQVESDQLYSAGELQVIPCPLEYSMRQPSWSMFTWITSISQMFAIPEITLAVNS